MPHVRERPKTPDERRWDFMRLRENGILIYLDDKELKHLNKQVAKTGLTRSTYIRKLIMGKEITARPAEEYFQILKTLNDLGCDVAQMARIAYRENHVAFKDINAAAQAVDEIMGLVRELKN